MILVVDDDQMFLEKARKILNSDRRVFLASTSEKAFTLAQDLGFSVVLVDLGLRGDDGLALIRRIHQSLPGLPVIALSDQTQRADPDLVRELGVVEVLQKPITPEWKPIVERVRAMRTR